MLSDNPIHLESRIRPAELYFHLSLVEKPRFIRLLDLHSPPTTSEYLLRGVSPELSGTLRVAKLDECPQFVALSYVWGNRTTGNTFINCNGCRIPITTSCHQALKAIRLPTRHVTVWVDAICIHQENENEKNTQIPLMHEIFTWAQKVYIWLGPGNENTEEIIHRMQHFATKWEFPGPIPLFTDNSVQTMGRQSLKYGRAQLRIFLSLISELFPLRSFFPSISYHPIDNHFDEFLNQHWLHRAWTFQEIALASAPVILCGNSRLDWKQFVQSFEFLSLASRRIKKPPNIGDGVHLNRFDPKKITESKSFREWSALIDIWVNMSRPLHWNGKECQSTSTSLSLGTSSSMLEYMNALNPSETLRLVPAIAVCMIFFGGPGIVFILRTIVTQVIHNERFATALQVLVALYIFCLEMLLLTRSYLHGWSRFPTYAIPQQLQANADTQMRSVHIIGLARAIRERHASEPKDRTIAVSGVLHQLGCSPPKPNPSRSLGQVYHEFSTSVFIWDPCFINLLLDAGSSLQDAPTWVPSFYTIQDRSWLPQAIIYTLFETAEWSKENLEVHVDGLNLSVTAAVIGTCSSLVAPFSHIELDEEGAPRLETDNTLRHTISFLYRWLAVIRRDISVPRGYSSLSQSLFDVLSGEARDPRVRDDDQVAFDGLINIQRHYPDTRPGIDILDAPPEVMIEIQRKKYLLDYILRICQKLYGKRGLFYCLDGYMGSGPETMKSDDTIFIIKGVAAPMILRQTDDTSVLSYRIIGPAFVPGLLDLGKKSLDTMSLDWERVTLV